MITQTFEAARVSLVGNRKCNQDRSLILSTESTSLLAVADGLGGHPRGEVAAQLFIDVCESLFRQQAKPLRDPEQFMLLCAHRAHQAIIAFGDRQSPPIAPRTTAVMAVIQDGVAYWTHVGDSRLYLIRDNHVLAQTRDHSKVHYIRPEAGAESRARSAITRCLGGLDQPPTVTAGAPTQLVPGDKLLLCSDGLWSQVSEDQILMHLDLDVAIGDALQELAEEAERNGYPRSDNVTALSLSWQPRLARGGQTTPAPKTDDRLSAAVRHLRKVLSKQKPS